MEIFNELMYMLIKNLETGNLCSLSIWSFTLIVCGCLRSQKKAWGKIKLRIISLKRTLIASVICFYTKARGRCSFPNTFSIFSLFLCVCMSVCILGIYESLIWCYCWEQKYREEGKKYLISSSIDSTNENLVLHSEEIVAFINFTLTADEWKLFCCARQTAPAE